MHVRFGRRVCVLVPTTERGGAARFRPASRCLRNWFQLRFAKLADPACPGQTHRHHRDGDSPGRACGHEDCSSQPDTSQIKEQSSFSCSCSLHACVAGAGRLSAAQAPEASSLSTLPLRPGRRGGAYHGRLRRSTRTQLTSLPLAFPWPVQVSCTCLTSAGQGRGVPRVSLRRTVQCCKSRQITWLSRMNPSSQQNKHGT